MPKKSSFDFTIFDRYEWTGKSAAVTKEGQTKKYVKFDFFDYRSRLSLDAKSLYLLDGFIAVHLSGSNGVAKHMQWGSKGGAMWEQCLSKLKHFGHIQAFQSNPIQSNPIIAEAPLPGSPSESFLSSRKNTRDREESPSPNISGADDSPSQEVVKKPNDFQVLAEWYMECVRRYHKIDPGNVYKDGKSLGIIKGILGIHGLEGSKTIINHAFIAQKEGAIEYLVKTNASLHGIMATRLEILEYASTLKRRREFIKELVGNGSGNTVHKEGLRDSDGVGSQGQGKPD